MTKAQNKTSKVTSKPVDEESSSEEESSDDEPAKPVSKPVVKVRHKYKMLFIVLASLTILEIICMSYVTFIILLYFNKVQTPSTKSPKVVPKKKEESSSSEESSDEEEPAKPVKPVSKPVGKVSSIQCKLCSVLTFVQSKKPAVVAAAMEESSDSDEESSSSEEQAVTAAKAKAVQNANQDSSEDTSSSEEEAPAKPKVQ